jgi:hypothetical protein
VTATSWPTDCLTSSMDSNVCLGMTALLSG